MAPPNVNEFLSAHKSMCPAPPTTFNINDESISHFQRAALFNNESLDHPIVREWAKARFPNESVYLHSNPKGTMGFLCLTSDRKVAKQSEFDKIKEWERLDGNPMPSVPSGTITVFMATEDFKMPAKDCPGLGPTILVPSTFTTGLNNFNIHFEQISHRVWAMYFICMDIFFMAGMAVDLALEEDPEQNLMDLEFIITKWDQANVSNKAGIKGLEGERLRAAQSESTFRIPHGAPFNKEQVIFSTKCNVTNCSLFAFKTVDERIEIVCYDMYSSTPWTRPASTLLYMQRIVRSMGYSHSFTHEELAGSREKVAVMPLPILPTTAPFREEQILYKIENCQDGEGYYMIMRSDGFIAIYCHNYSTGVWTTRVPHEAYNEMIQNVRLRRIGNAEAPTQMVSRIDYYVETTIPRPTCGPPPLIYRVPTHPIAQSQRYAVPCVPNAGVVQMPIQTASQVNHGRSIVYAAMPHSNARSVPVNAQVQTAASTPTQSISPAQAAVESLIQAQAAAQAQYPVKAAAPKKTVDPDQWRTASERLWSETHNAKIFTDRFADFADKAHAQLQAYNASLGNVQTEVQASTQAPAPEQFPASGILSSIIKLAQLGQQQEGNTENEKDTPVEAVHQESQKAKGALDKAQRTMDLLTMAAGFGGLIPRTGNFFPDRETIAKSVDAVEADLRAVQKSMDASLQMATNAVKVMELDSEKQAVAAVETGTSGTSSTGIETTCKVLGSAIENLEKQMSKVLGVPIGKAESVSSDGNSSVASSVDVISSMSPISVSSARSNSSDEDPEAFTQQIRDQNEREEIEMNLRILRGDVVIEESDGEDEEETDEDYDEDEEESESDSDEDSDSDSGSYVSDEEESDSGDE